jgi:hypothetical protein
VSDEGITQLLSGAARQCVTLFLDDGARPYRLRLLENTKLQSSISPIGRELFTALWISRMSMPCLLADLMMQFWTYFWRFRCVDGALAIHKDHPPNAKNSRR